MGESEVLWGVPLSDFIVSCSLFFLFLILPFLTPPFFRYITVIIDRIDGDDAHESYLDEDIRRLLPTPVSVLLQATLLHAIVLLMHLPEEVADEAEIASVLLMVLAGLWCGSRIVDVASLQIPPPKAAKLRKEKLGEYPDGVAKVFSKLFKSLILGLMILIGLQVFGVPITPLLTGLGLGGLAVGLAASDTLSNMFGTLVIYLDDPFRLNDYVEIGGVSGEVVTIGLRTSKIRTFYGDLVTVPNRMVATGTVSNVYRKDKIRHIVKVKLSTEGDIGAFLKDVRAALVGMPGVELLDDTDPRQSCSVVDTDGMTVTVEIHVFFPLGHLSRMTEINKMKKALGVPEPVDGARSPDADADADADADGAIEADADGASSSKKDAKKHLLDDDEPKDEHHPMRPIMPEPTWNYFGAYRYMREDLHLMLVDKMRSHNCVFKGSGSSILYNL